MLSWWQHPVNVVGLLVAVALIAGMIGWLVADAGGDAGGGEVDVGFLHDMRAHHEQAVQMGFMYLALADTDPGLRTVARSIVTGQNIDIGRMIQLLRDSGRPRPPRPTRRWRGWACPRRSTRCPAWRPRPSSTRSARRAAPRADELFVELMVDHHQGGLHMAETAAVEAEDDEVRSMAASIVASQADEIGELERLVD